MLPDKSLSSHLNLAHEIGVLSEHIDEPLVAEGLTSMQQETIAQLLLASGQNQPTDDGQLRCLFDKCLFIHDSNPSKDNLIHLPMIITQYYF